MIKTNSLMILAGLVFASCGVQTFSGLQTIESLVTLKLKVTGLQKSDQPTQICYAVFNSPDGFPNDSGKVVKEGCLGADSESLEFEIDEIPSLKKGFVVSVFQDLNMSGKMETKKFFGFTVPAESFGFTNNPSIMRGAPSFENCRISGAAGAVYEIKMKKI